MLGVWVLDSFCADLAPSLADTEEEDCPVSPRDSTIADSLVVSSSEPGHDS